MSNDYIYYYPFPIEGSTPSSPSIGWSYFDLSLGYPQWFDGANWQPIPPVATSVPLINGTAAIGTSKTYTPQDHVHPTDTSRAALASPTFTGTPAGPTAAVKTNTTQLATTAFVNAEISAIPQTSAPTTGQTVTVTSPQMISNWFVNPAGALLALTLTLSNGTIQGQIVFVTITQAITTLTVTATNIGTNGIASPTAVATATTFAWHWNNTTTKWNRFL